MLKICNMASQFLKNLLSLKKGDWLIVVLSLAAIALLFKTQWSDTPATKVEVRVSGHVYATYSLNIRRDIKVKGKIGETVIQIGQGKARFLHAPCRNQYCVHQSWLTRAGQVAICLPNQVVLELLGEDKLYDSLNY